MSAGVKSELNYFEKNPDITLTLTIMISDYHEGSTLNSLLKKVSVCYSAVFLKIHYHVDYGRF